MLLLLALLPASSPPDTLRADAAGDTRHLGAAIGGMVAGNAGIWAFNFR